METPSADTLQIGTMIIGLLGGLAIFLFGMDQISNGLKTVAGHRMKNVLGQLTTNRFKAATGGAFITAIIRSSSVTTVLVVGFITAGLMNLAQSVGVIMGANIGSTVTAQIIAFKVTKLALVLIIVGFIPMFVAKRQRYKQIGAMIMGLGLIFLGMEMMSQATYPLRDYRPFILLMQQVRSPLTAILISAAFTAVIQSSAATTGVVIVLASQGLMTLETSIAFIFGANIGTCITALLAAIGKPTEAVQAATVHILFNVIGVLIWLPFIPQLAELSRMISPSTTDLVGPAQLVADAPREIANAHTIFNVANTLLFLPFTVQIAWVAKKLVPERPVAQPDIIQPQYLDSNLLTTPELALDRVRLEINRLGICALQMVWKSLPMVISGSQEDLDTLAELDSDVDTLHGAIVAYLGKLSQDNLLRPQTELLYDYMAVATYIENIGDMVETNLVEAGEERLRWDVTVSAPTQQAIHELHEKICWSVEEAINSVILDSKATAQLVIDAKPEINRLSDAIDGHLATRLVADEPNRLNAFRIESDIVENYRRIYYFAKRIAKAVVETDLNRRVEAVGGLQPARQYAAEMPAQEPGTELTIDN